MEKGETTVALKSQHRSQQDSLREAHGVRFMRMCCLLPDYRWAPGQSNENKQIQNVGHAQDNWPGLFQNSVSWEKIGAGDRAVPE